MDDKRKAIILREKLRKLNKEEQVYSSPYMPECLQDEKKPNTKLKKDSLKKELALLPHIQNKKEAKIIRRLKKKHKIKTDEEVYAKFGKQIAEELKKSS